MTDKELLGLADDAKRAAQRVHQELANRGEWVAAVPTPAVPPALAKACREFIEDWQGFMADPGRWDFGADTMGAYVRSIEKALKAATPPSEAATPIRTPDKPPTAPVAAAEPRGADWFADVLEFMMRFQPGQVGRRPSGQAASSRLRLRLMREELNETANAMYDESLPGIADGLADLIYVAIGTAVAYGIDLRPVWAAVHRANMAKTGGPTRADGKLLKPPGWQAPDVAGILARQGDLTSEPPSVDRAAWAAERRAVREAATNGEASKPPALDMLVVACRELDKLWRDFMNDGDCMNPLDTPICERINDIREALDALATEPQANTPPSEDEASKPPAAIEPRGAAVYERVAGPGDWVWAGPDGSMIQREQPSPIKAAIVQQDNGEAADPLADTSEHAVCSGCGYIGRVILSSGNPPGQERCIIGCKCSRMLPPAEKPDWLFIVDAPAPETASIGLAARDWTPTVNGQPVSPAAALGTLCEVMRGLAERDDLPASRLIASEILKAAGKLYSVIRRKAERDERPVREAVRRAAQEAASKPSEAASVASRTNGFLSGGL